MGVRRRRYEEVRAHYALRRMDAQGELGRILIALRLPDGSTGRHRFWEGAPREALVALAWESDWAKASQPSAVSFFTGFPAEEVDQEGDIDSRMHGATLIVRERSGFDGTFEADLSSTCSQECEGDRLDLIDESEEEEAPQEQPEASLAHSPSLCEVASQPVRRIASYHGSVLTNYAGISRAPSASVQQAGNPAFGSGRTDTREQLLDADPSTEQLFAMPWPTMPCPANASSGTGCGACVFGHRRRQPRRPRVGPEPLGDCCKGAALGCLSAWAVIFCASSFGFL